MPASLIKSGLLVCVLTCAHVTMVMFEQKIATSGEKTLGVCVLYVCYRKPTVIHVI